MTCGHFKHVIAKAAVAIPRRHHLFPLAREVVTAFTSGSSQKPRLIGPGGDMAMFKIDAVPASRETMVMLFDGWTFTPVSFKSPNSRPDDPQAIRARSTSPSVDVSAGQRRAAP